MKWGESTDLASIHSPHTTGWLMGLSLCFEAVIVGLHLKRVLVGLSMGMCYCLDRQEMTQFQKKVGALRHANILSYPLRF
jgi:hypothetical protein